MISVAGHTSFTRTQLAKPKPALKASKVTVKCSSEVGLTYLLCVLLPTQRDWRNPKQQSPNVHFTDCLEERKAFHVHLQGSSAGPNWLT